MLSQAEANTLIALGKIFVNSATISFGPGLDETYELAAIDGKERFLLDLWRGTFRLSRIKYQNRCRVATVLVRLDIDGAPHTNPDGTRIGGTHIHVYHEGFEDKWAFPVDRSRFVNLVDPPKIFDDFCAYCNIQRTASVQAGLI